MQRIKVKIDKQEALHHFRGTNENGMSINMDSNDRSNFRGPTPIEVLLMSIGGCSGIDVVDSMHEENHVLEDFSIEVVGYRDKSVVPSLVKEIEVNYGLKGEIPEAKVLRAVAISISKYCTVAKMLSSEVTVNHSVELNGKKIKKMPDLKQI